MKSYTCVAIVSQHRIAITEHRAHVPQVVGD